MQLIQSVLFSIQVYENSIFVPFQKTFNDIEGVLGAFLWLGAEMKHIGAKVSWENLCA